MSIRIFSTGGTFDKEYDEIHGELYFKETHIPEILKTGRCTAHVDVRTLMMIDSTDMTDEDRETIAQNCAKALEDKIIVTHGTDTMVQTAHAIAGKKIDKIIVLTGAMIPYKFGSSDGFFNIGCALGFVQCLGPGVYIVMNGKCFTWDNCKKNLKTGIFEAMKEHEAE